jgi:hypothetical protein
VAYEAGLAYYPGASSIYSSNSSSISNSTPTPVRGEVGGLPGRELVRELYLPGCE